MKVELHANQGHRWARGGWGVGRSGRYANERPCIDGQGDAGVGENIIPGRDDVSSWGITDYANGEGWGLCK